MIIPVSVVTASDGSEASKGLVKGSFCDRWQVFG